MFLVQCTIRVIGNSVIANIYYYFVLGTLKIILVILKYTTESCKLVTLLCCRPLQAYPPTQLHSCILAILSSLPFFCRSLPLANHHLILSACLLIDSFNQLDVNFLNC